MPTVPEFIHDHRIELWFDLWDQHTKLGLTIGISIFKVSHSIWHSKIHIGQTLLYLDAYKLMHTLDSQLSMHKESSTFPFLQVILKALIETKLVSLICGGVPSFIVLHVISLEKFFNIVFLWQSKNSPRTIIVYRYIQYKRCAVKIFRLKILI